MMNIELQIQDFINRRFQKDSNWCDGNCFYFALILSYAFNGEIYYDPVLGHFVSKIDTKYYDWHGEFIPQYKMLAWVDIKKEDPLWADRLIRDCIL